MPILRNPIPNIFIPDNICLSQIILEKIQEYGSAVALIDDATGRTISYAELRQTIFLVAGKLLERGTQKGDVIFVCVPNCVEFSAILLASLHVGAVVTTCNPAYTEGESMLSSLFLLGNTLYTLE